MRRLLVALLLALALVAGFVTLQRTLPAWYVRALPPAVARHFYPLEHRQAIADAARDNGLDPALIAGLIYRESGYRETAVSEQGAIGLMQIMPATAREIARRTGGERFRTADLNDAEINIRYGSHYLATLLQRYDGSVIEAVAAYNAGVRNVDEWVREARREGRGLKADDIPFPETREYVVEVERLAELYRRAYDDQLGAT